MNLSDRRNQSAHHFKKHHLHLYSRSYSSVGFFNQNPNPHHMSMTESQQDKKNHLRRVLFIKIKKIISRMSCQAVHRGSSLAGLHTTSVRKLLPGSWGFVCLVHTHDGTLSSHT